MRVLLLSRYGRLGASSRIRAYQYLPYLASRGIEAVVQPFFGDEYLRSYYSGKGKPIAEVAFSYCRRIAALLACSRYDLVWLEYEMLPWFPALAEILLAKLDMPYLVDYDDAIFHRYDLHPHPLIRRTLGGKIDAVMRHAAIVVAGNDYLRDHALAAGARRVEIIPSSVDTAHYHPAPPSETFTIGWIGSPATSAYLRRLRGVLTELRRRENFRLLLIGAESDFDALPCEIRPWSEEAEVSAIGEFDVGIMPLPDGPWERGKCGYKLIQYMACAKPVVCSPVGANLAIVEPGVEGFLAATDEEWRSALTDLMASPGLRERMGHSGRTKVERDYAVHANAPRLYSLLREAAGR